MSRRGRPPHPDILTPREWEVLALLREGLSDEAIAERLGVSIHGAKYHVREILSKLGVSSRQEAAAWEPEERAPARQWPALPLAARIGAALVIVAAVAVLGVLAWGVWQTGGDATQITAPSPATPEAGMRLSRDQALLRAGGSPIENAGSVDVEMAGSRWRVTTTGMFNQFGGSPHSIPFGATIVDEMACREVRSSFPDDPSSAGPAGARSEYGVGPPISDSNCEPTELTRDLAIVIGGRAAWTDYGNADPPRPTAEEMSFGEAADALKDRGAEMDKSPPLDISARRPVWLVTLKGQFFGFEGEIPEDGATPRPTTIISCAARFVIVDVDSREVLYQAQSQDDSCD